MFMAASCGSSDGNTSTKSSSCVMQTADTDTKLKQPLTAASSSASTGRSKRAATVSANVKLDRIEAGINQIISLLTADAKTPAGQPQNDASAAPSQPETSTDWKRLAEELQETIDSLMARLETQAAQLDSVKLEAERQRESAEAERQDLRRRLASFRRQLDASQTARARLSASLAKAEAELAELKRANSNDIEETVEALTAQLDRSNEQLEVALLTRSCSCDQRLHECCRREGGPGNQQERLQRSCDFADGASGVTVSEQRAKVRPSSTKPTSRREPRSGGEKRKTLVGEAAAKQSGRDEKLK